MKHLGKKLFGFLMIFSCSVNFMVFTSYANTSVNLGSWSVSVPASSNGKEYGIKEGYGPGGEGKYYGISWDKQDYDLYVQVGEYGNGIPVPSGGELVVPVYQEGGGGGGTGHNPALGGWVYNMDSLKSTDIREDFTYYDFHIKMSVYNADNKRLIKIYDYMDSKTGYQRRYKKWCDECSDYTIVQYLGDFEGDFEGRSGSIYQHSSGNHGGSGQNAVWGKFHVDIPSDVTSVYIRFDLKGGYGGEPYAYGFWTGCWEIPGYTISYNANGGVGSIESQFVSFGEDVSLRSNTFTRTGYSFKGFGVSSDGSGTTFSSGQYLHSPNWSNYISDFSGNAVLYALWEPITYEVRIYPNVPSSATSTIKKNK